MKKFIAFLALAFCAFGAMAQKAAPEFNGKNGAVIDANKISGVFKSAIVVEDKILDDAEMSVNVYAWYAEDWLPLGTASLNQFDATAKIASQKEIKIADLRYFAIESEDRVLAFKARKFKKDLVIEVRDATSDLSKPVVPAFEQNPDAVLFDKMMLSVECDEKLYLRNLTSHPSIGFKVSVYEPKRKQWEEFGTVVFKKLTQQSKVNSKDVNSRRYFAIEAVDGEEYQYVMSVAKNNDDIIIDISNPKKKAEK